MFLKSSNQSILEEICPEYSLKGLMLKLKYFGDLMWRANSLKKTLMLREIEGNMRSGYQRIRWIDSITDSMDMYLNKLQEIVENKGAWRAVVHGVTKSWIRLNDWTTTKVLGRFWRLELAVDGLGRNWPEFHYLGNCCNGECFYL